jgi:small subunit ribosomal protein S7
MKRCRQKKYNMRGKSATKRNLAPDTKYGSILVAKLVNYVMEDGKKSIARGIVYDAFDIIASETKRAPLEVFEEAVKNVTPAVEVKSKRVGGANYQVPMPVRGDRRYALVYRWILLAARGKKGRPMCEKLAEELMAAARNEGDAVKKKLDVQRMAEANRAFAHLAR